MQNSNFLFFFLDFLCVVLPYTPSLHSLDQLCCICNIFQQWSYCISVFTNTKNTKHDSSVLVNWHSTTVPSPSICSLIFIERLLSLELWSLNHTLSQQLWLTGCQSTTGISVEIDVWNAFPGHSLMDIKLQVMKGIVLKIKRFSVRK